MIFVSALSLNLKQLNIDQAGASFLAPADLKKIHSVKSEKRKKEILASRHLIKNILETAYRIKIDKIPIEKNKFGRPFLSHPECKDLHISYAHDAENVVAVCSKKTVIGIDIEETDRFKEHKAFYKWLHKDEMALLQSNKLDTDDLCKIWSKKEALAKATQKGYQLRFKGIRVHEKDSILLENKEYYFYSPFKTPQSHTYLCSDSHIHSENVKVIKSSIWG